MVLGKPHNDEKGPQLADVKCFLFKPGNGVMIHKGTWHDFPLAIKGPGYCDYRELTGCRQGPCLDERAGRDGSWRRLQDRHQEAHRQNFASETVSGGRVKADVFKIASSGPADISELVRLMDEGKIVPSEVVCIIGKTEGNGGRNDFTRDLAMTAFEDLLLAAPGNQSQGSGGLHHLFFVPAAAKASFLLTSASLPQAVRSRQFPKRRNGWQIGIGFTRAFKPEELGAWRRWKRRQRLYAK